jgi:CHAT domain-containing protein
MNWKSPPYFVFSSACESGRSAGGKRLISNERHSNGLAAAFIAAGVSGYAGYFWQVSDTGAGVFAQKFYKYLFEEENLGKAFLEARKRTSWDLDAVRDLAGYGAVLFGDAATSERLDLVRMGR